MPLAVAADAVLQCTMGVAPCPLQLAPTPVKSGGQTMATAMDNKAEQNIAGFVMCTSMGNPSVASKLGAPQPCQPQISAPWVPGKPNIMVGGKPAVDQTAKLICDYGGEIMVDFPGQVVVQIK